MSKDALEDEYILKMGKNPGSTVLSWILNTGSALTVASKNHQVENLEGNFILTEKDMRGITDKNIRTIQER
jgi:diketogulonate reductase-like aldo/keto reductase